jgi:hypothetical protein
MSENALESEAAASPSKSGIFGAYLEMRRRRRTPWFYALAVLGIAAAALAVRVDPRAHKVVTPHGIRTVRSGMTQAQVKHVLGKPIGAISEGEAECLQYGTPKLETPKFVVYSLCYQNGQLRDVTEKFYNAWAVNPDGTLKAPAESEGG